jgi:hypothetical protein
LSAAAAITRGSDFLPVAVRGARERGIRRRSSRGSAAMVRSAASAATGGAFRPDLPLAPFFSDLPLPRFRGGRVCAIACESMVRAGSNIVEPRNGAVYVLRG